MVNPKLNCDPTKDDFNKPMDIWVPTKEAFEQVLSKIEELEMRIKKLEEMDNFVGVITSPFDKHKIF